MADEPRSPNPREIERAIANERTQPTNPEYFDQPAKWGKPGEPSIEDEMADAVSADQVARQQHDADAINYLKRATSEPVRYPERTARHIVDEITSEPTNPALVGVESEIDKITEYLNKELDELDASTNEMRELVNSSASNLKLYIKNYGRLGERVLEHNEKIRASLSEIATKMQGK